MAAIQTRRESGQGLSLCVFTFTELLSKKPDETILIDLKSKSTLRHASIDPTRLQNQTNQFDKINPGLHHTLANVTIWADLRI